MINLITVIKILFSYLIASSGGYSGTVEALIKANVDLNAQDVNGRTALMLGKTLKFKK